MRRRIISLTALLAMAWGAPHAGAETAAPTDPACREYCANKAVEKCDDVTSTWCNAYIVGCLAGCGISHL